MFAQLVVTVAGQLEIPGSNDGTAFEATFNNPHGIAVDSDGTVYTVDRWSHIVRKITTDGMVTTVAGSPGVAGSSDGYGAAALFNEPWGICARNGIVYVADTRNNKIRKIGVNGEVTTIAGTGNYGTSNGSGSSATFGNPTGIAVDANGILYVADHLTHIIRKIDNNNVVSTLAGIPYMMGDEDGPGNIATFARPYGLTLDLDGNILVADEWNHKIRKINPTGLVSTVAGIGVVGHEDGAANEAMFNYPWDVAVDANGVILVADGYNYVIRRIFNNGQVMTYCGGVTSSGGVDGIGSNARFSGATTIANSPLTNEIFVGDAYNHLVRKIIDLNEGVSLFVTNGVSTVCQGDPIAVQASPAIFNQYEFSIDGVFYASSNDFSFETSILSPGTHTISVVATNNTGTSSSEVLVEILPAAEVNITIIGETEFIEGDSVILIASESSSYDWSNGSSAATITVLESGFYDVSVTNAIGCTGVSDSIQIIVNPALVAPQISFNGSTTLCPGESLLLIGDQSDSYQWLKDGWPIDGATQFNFEATTTGIYQLQTTTNDGVNLFSEEVEVTILDVLDLAISSDVQTGLVNDLFEFSCSENNGTSYSWEFGDGNASEEIKPSHRYESTGVYSITLNVTDENNCINTIVAENYISVLDEENLDQSDWFIPNAFSPNGDGENDQFGIRGQYIASYDLQIFNHWGELIFQSDSTDWDGLQNGQEVQPGNYVYLITARNQLGEEELFKGHVLLLK